VHFLIATDSICTYLAVHGYSSKAVKKCSFCAKIRENLREREKKMRIEREVDGQTDKEKENVISTVAVGTERNAFPLNWLD